MSKCFESVQELTEKTGFRLGGKGGGRAADQAADSMEVDSAGGGIVGDVAENAHAERAADAVSRTSCARDVLVYSSIAYFPVRRKWFTRRQRRL